MTRAIKFAILLHLDPALAKVRANLSFAQFEPELGFQIHQFVNDLGPWTEGSDILELTELALGQVTLDAVLDADGRDLLEAAALFGPLLELDVVPVGERAGFGLGGLGTGQILEGTPVRARVGRVGVLDLDNPLHNVRLASHGSHLEEGVAADLATEGESIDIVGGEKFLDDGGGLTTLDGVGDGAGGLVGTTGLLVSLLLTVLGLLLLLATVTGVGGGILALGGLIVGYLRWLDLLAGSCERGAIGSDGCGVGITSHRPGQTIDRGLLHTARHHLLNVVHRTTMDAIGTGTGSKGGKGSTQVVVGDGTIGFVGLLLLIVSLLGGVLGGVEAAPRFIIVAVVVIGIGRSPIDEAGHGAMGGMVGLFIRRYVVILLGFIITIRPVIFLLVVGEEPVNTLVWRIVIVFE